MAILWPIFGENWSIIVVAIGKYLILSHNSLHLLSLTWLLVSKHNFRSIVMKHAVKPFNIYYIASYKRLYKKNQIKTVTKPAQKLANRFMTGPYSVHNYPNRRKKYEKLLKLIYINTISLLKLFLFKIGPKLFFCESTLFFDITKRAKGGNQGKTSSILL